MEKLYKKDKIEGGSKMETGTMKNMIILKNLPSNLVEEAIVILKSSKKVKKLEKIERIEKGLNQVKKFTWASCATDTIKRFKE